MIIGRANGNIVRYSEVDKSVRVSNTSILIVGVNTKEEAIERCKVNLKNFEEEA